MPRPSDRPRVDGTSIGDIYMGFTEIRLGGKSLDEQPDENAWTSFGFDLDGLCTNSATCEGVATTGCRSPGPGFPYDGQLCRDNTLGRLLPVIAAGPELSEKFGVNEDTFNCQLHRGGYNMLVRLSQYNGEPDDASVRVDYYLSTGLEEPSPWTCPTPDFRKRYQRWRSLRTWAVDNRALAGPTVMSGELPESKFADAEAYVKHGYLVANVPDGTEQGFLGSGDPYRGFVFKLAQGVFVGRLVHEKDGTWSIDDGLIGGRVRKEDVVRSLRETGFCEVGDVSTFYQIMLDFVNQTVDTIATGEVNSSLPCDALSYGFAFKAAELQPGQSVTVPPRIECCAPGRSIEDCMASCGDGKVNGDEKCDTLIPAGEAGACPTSCETTDPCRPRMLVGTACTTECIDLPAPPIGAQDRCCPANATVATDVDCSAHCGNGVIERGETCDPPSSCAPCVKSTCFSVIQTGTANTCDLKCEYKELGCMSGDECCPGACSSELDSDCSTTCHDGKQDKGETCEDGTNVPCPNCDDGNPCTADWQVGSAANCSISCLHRAITAPIDGDKCCPAGASANSDSDCPAMCGNRVIEPGEQCDDGNTASGDGCFECKTEDAQQVCMMKLGADNACNRCTCQNCQPQTQQCFDYREPEGAKRCRDMVECSRTNDCGSPDCYCGTASLLSCLAGNGNGKCKREVELAAGSTSLVDIDARSTDTNFALGRSNALFTCLNRFCQQECAGMGVRKN